MSRLAGKVALITGAARGQGEAEAQVFVAEGAKVVLGDVMDDLGKAVAKSLGDSAIYLHHDVSREESWANFVATALQTFGRIDILVNNAGILHVAPIAEIKLENYMRVIHVNQVGCLLGMKSVIPHMTKAGGGSIINISSISGIEGAIGLVSYVSSKFAIRGMTKTAALELGRLGIRVNSICPGGIDTPMGRGDSEGFENIDSSAWYRSLPLQRIGKPEEVAKLALYLASSDSAYCTGAEFVIDGGALAGERFA
ncbi:MAG TPA: glucose 1-dehydrogenase [Myxococcota bacterium]|nr:glucose 1-dehydrogenase [Myxococcota bacterium]